jgi:hypothetical protein
MIVYMNRMPKYKYSRWQKIKNMFLPRLIGINVVHDRSGKDPEIMPVYIPFVRYEKGNGMLLIELAAWTHDAVVILLYSQWPFVYVTRGGGTELDIKRIGDDE